MGGERQRLETQVAAAAVFMEAAEPESEPELEPSTTSVPVAVDDPGIADRALAFLAGELGVPESEVWRSRAQRRWLGPTRVWAARRRGYAYAQVLTPGYRFSFSHGGSASLMTCIPTSKEATSCGLWAATTPPRLSRPQLHNRNPSRLLRPRPPSRSRSRPRRTVPEPEPEVVEEPEPPTTTGPEEPEQEAESVKPWEQETEPEYVWVPPQAGMVPEVWPLCADDRADLDLEMHPAR